MIGILVFVLRLVSYVLCLLCGFCLFCAFSFPVLGREYGTHYVLKSTKGEKKKNYNFAKHVYGHPVAFPLKGY